MKNITLSKIFKSGILGILLLVLLLTPVSIQVLGTHTGGDTLSFEILTNTTYAEGVVSTLASGVVGVTWDPLIQTLGTVLLGFTSMTTWMGGKLLDLTISSLVLGMGEKLTGVGLGGAIDQTWSLIRDISNLAFIFGFIYCGIRIILSPDDSSLKSFVSRIIIGALLINFSLFFVKIIIDFSNFASIQIYNAMMTGNGTLATSLTDALGIITIYKVPDAATLATLAGGSKGIAFYLMASVFCVVAGFTFAAAALMLIVRFVTLIFIMVFSPILFAATVFPQTAKYSEQLWGKLLDTAFYAPVFLLITFVSITIINGLNIAPAGGTFVNALTNQGDGSSFGVIMQFCIIIFFMMQSLLIANKFSIGGSEMITAKTKTLIGASTAGLAARAGRASLGRYAYNASESEDLKDRASKGGTSGWIAQQQLKAYRGVGDASFDGRNTGVGKKLGVGDGRKGGYESVKKEVSEAEEKFAKSLGEVGDDDFRVEGRKKEMEEAKTHVRHLQEELKTLRDPKERKEMSDKIEGAKHHEHEAKVKYETEKQRRILGSTYEKPAASAVSQLNEHKANIVMQKAELKKAWANYLAETDETKKEKLGESITQFKNELKEEQDRHDALLNENTKDRGYAGVNENSKWYTAWPAGRLVSHEQAAGKAMRKARKDGLPKEKGGHGDGHGGGHDAGHGEHSEEHEEEHDTTHAASSVIVSNSVGGGARQNHVNVGVNGHGAATGGSAAHGNH